MKGTLRGALVGITIFVWAAGGPQLFAQALNTNLITNPGAELSAGSPNFNTTLPPAGWTTTSNFSAVQYGFGTGEDLNSSDSSAIGGGNNYFSGGLDNPSSSASQTISLAGLAEPIDAGALQAVLSGFLGGYSNAADNMTLTALFRDGSGASLKSIVIGPVFAAERGNQSQLVFRATAAEIPAGTRSVVLTLLATRTSGLYNDAYADNLSFQVTAKPTAKPIAGEFYYTTFGGNNVFGWGSFVWDGTSVSAPTHDLAQVPGFLLDGSMVVGADGNIYSGRAGSMSQMNPVTKARVTVNTGVNNNVTSIDPPRTTVYAGWKDAALATLATGASFGPGTPHGISGDDTVATALAWLPNGEVWYVTGGEDRLGNVGKINLTTFTTVRVLSGVTGTDITYDPFTKHLFTAGIDGIAQIDPVTGTVVSTWKNPQGIANYLQNIEATGQGHLVAFDSSNLFRLWDFSSGSRLIGSPDTIHVTAPVPVFSGGLALADVPDFLGIISPLTAKARVGQQFTYVVETNQPITSSSASNLPPGLTYNSVVPRAITGTPTQAGTFSVALTATNGSGTTNETLTITVDSAASTPQLISGTSATARNGRPFRFQVISTGGTAASRVTATNLPTGLTLDSASGVISGTPTLDGSFAVTLTLTTGAQTSTAILQLTVTSDPAFPVIISPNTTIVTPGQDFSYTIVAPTSTSASDPVIFQLIGTLPAGFNFNAATGTISGTGVAAQYLNDAEPNKPTLSGGIVGNVQLFARNSSGTGTIPLVFFLAPTGAVNISTRMSVGLGDNVMIGGFIITGNAPKAVIIRAIGPSLKTIPGALQDPNLDLFDGAGHLLGSNNNWRDSQENEIINTSIPPTDDRESAILAGLTPGNYTAVVSGRNGTTGIAVVEAYDLGTASLDTSSKAQLAQISTRGTVLTDDNVMIGGFIISGSATKVIVRAIGPSLNGTLSGALQDTTLDLVNGSGTIVRSNDDWQTDQKQEIIDTTVPPSDTHESAIVATLNAGAYTGIVRGKGNTTGVALVEVYSLQ